LSRKSRKWLETGIFDPIHGYRDLSTPVEACQDPLATITRRPQGTFATLTRPSNRLWRLRFRPCEYVLILSERELDKLIAFARNEPVKARIQRYPVMDPESPQTGQITPSRVDQALRLMRDGSNTPLPRQPFRDPALPARVGRSWFFGTPLGSRRLALDR
jgi:hypothetical protein